MSIGLVLSFVISFAVAFGSTPVVKALAQRIGAVSLMRQEEFTKKQRRFLVVLQYFMVL